MIVYLVEMNGVYTQDYGGLFSTREAAEAQAETLDADSDGYHSFEVVRFVMDEPMWPDHRGKPHEPQPEPEPKTAQQLRLEAEQERALWSQRLAEQEAEAARQELVREGRERAAEFAAGVIGDILEQSGPMSMSELGDTLARRPDTKDFEPATLLAAVSRLQTARRVQLVGHARVLGLL